MQIIDEPDAAALLVRAQALLAPTELQHNLLLGVLHSVANGAYNEPKPWLWSVRDAAGQHVGVALRTPPHNLLVSRMPRVALAALAQRICERALLPLPLMAEERVADTLCAELARIRPIETQISAALRLFELRSVANVPSAPGALRRVTSADLSLLTDYLEAFEREAQPQLVGKRDLGVVAARMITQGSVYFWQDQSRAGCLGAIARRVGAGAAIGPVYTPHALRGRGYASSLVAALSQLLLDEGCTYTCLFTDLSNPTSNSIYPKVGYQPRLDMREVMVRPVD